MTAFKRKVILDLAVTLDGFIEGPNGEIDWCIMDGESNFLDFLDTIDTIFYGRVSYELWGNYEPGPDSAVLSKQICDAINAKAKYVFSKTKEKDDTGNATYITGNVPDWVSNKLNTPGKDIWLYGGADLITSFINAELVDELRLAVHPVILGAGKPLFQHITKRASLRLESVIASKNGVAQMTYAVIK